MRFNSIREKLWPFRSSAPDLAIVRDADRLIEIWGDAAYDAAANMSWREDTGLMSTSRPGHWSRVAREIGFRQGRNPREPEADFAAAADRPRLLS